MSGRTKGRPRKASGGLCHVLYVRVDSGLMRALDRRVVRERALRRGHVVSHADVVRELLHRALEADS